MARPIIPLGDISFDPDLPSGNPEYDMSYPFEFRPAAGEYMFHRQSSLFVERVVRNHTGTVGAWRDIFTRFAPREHMISSQESPSFTDMEFDHLYTRRYNDVNSSYATALGEDGPPFSEENRLDLDQLSLHSVETEEVLNQIRRPARQADLYMYAFACNDPAVVGVVKQIALMFAEIKQLRTERHELYKHRTWVIAALCQSLKYIAYGYEMFGSTFGFLAIGQYFRRSVIVDGSFYVDIGSADDDNPLLIQDMPLYDLLLYGTGEDEDPRNVAQELRPDSAIADGAGGQAIYDYIKAVGQTWITETRRNPLPTFQEMGLTGKFARVAEFSLEGLGQACSMVFDHLSERREQGLLQREQARRDRQLPREQHPRRRKHGRGRQDHHQQEAVDNVEDFDDMPTMTPPNCTSSNGILLLTPEQPRSSSLIDEDDDPMLAKVRQKAEKGEELLSLKKKEKAKQQPGLTEKHKALLDYIVTASLDFEEELEEEMNDDPEFKFDNILRSIR